MMMFKQFKGKLYRTNLKTGEAPGRLYSNSYIAGVN
jgi:hypothetical protein